MINHCQQSYMKDLLFPLYLRVFPVLFLEISKSVKVRCMYICHSFIMNNINQQLQVRINQIPPHDMTDIAQTNFDFSAAEAAKLWDGGSNWIKLKAIEMVGWIVLKVSTLSTFSTSSVFNYDVIKLRPWNDLTLKLHHLVNVSSKTRILDTWMLVLNILKWFSESEYNRNIIAL